jgi:hypothetical protein
VCVVPTLGSKKSPRSMPYFVRCLIQNQQIICTSGLASLHPAVITRAGSIDRGCRAQRYSRSIDHLAIRAVGKRPSRLLDCRMNLRARTGRMNKTK